MSTWHAYCEVYPTIKCLLRSFLCFSDSFSSIYLHMAFVYISDGKYLTQVLSIPLLCPWQTSLINYSPCLLGEVSTADVTSLMMTSDLAHI